MGSFFRNWRHWAIDAKTTSRRVVGLRIRSIHVRGQETGAQQAGRLFNTNWRQGSQTATTEPRKEFGVDVALQAGRSSLTHPVVRDTFARF